MTQKGHKPGGQSGGTIARQERRLAKPEVTEPEQAKPAKRAKKSVKKKSKSKAIKKKSNAKH